MASGSYLTSAQQTRNSRGDRILPRTASGNNNSSSSSRRMVHNPGGSQRSLSPINRRQITMGSSQQLQGSYRGMKRTQTAPVPPKTSHTGPPTAAAPTMRRNQTAPIHHTTATNTKPKPRRLLVDYSKKRANLTQGRQTQSERTLLPPRTKSLDQLPDNRGSFATAHSYHDRPNSDRNLAATASSATAGPTNIPRGVLNRHNTTGMSRSQSAREVVDWHVLNSTLDWEKEEEKTRQSIASQHASSNTRRGRRRIQHQQPQQQESSSCSNLLRKSFLTKPLGTSSSHLQGTEFEFTPSFGGNNSYDDDNDQRGRQQHNHQTIAISRRASLSPKRKNVSPKLAEQRKKSIMISPQQRKNGLATSPALMDDESMRLGDVFGSSSRMDNSSSNDGNSRRRQQEPQEEDEPADDFFSRLDKEAQMPNHVQPLNQERLYRSMSALANTLVVPPKLVSLEQQQPRDSNVSVLSTASYLKDDSHDEEDDQQLQRNGSHNSNMDASVGDDVSVASVGSLSFRRTSGDKNKRNGSHHLKGSLAGLPSWDGDFDNSLSSSFSSHWEPMSDMSSVVSNNNNEMEKNHSRRSQQQQQSNNTPGSSPTKPRTLASSPTKQRNSGASPTGNNKQRSSAASRKMRVSNKAAASTALGIKEDEEDDEEEDLLFLPKSMQPARSPLDDSSSNNKRGGRSRSSANS
ncbi:expressed unknown protein [Seminavis robusta]|uniref:Uncharacterized protein n=1 Tax=Seminavis robusta TaxID=568900 RepID=A0A9N8E274_9STRA|nr:expressed unknown protein [Seminavis robusta]|eukprot:Sro578_g169880.1 n/a (687) ;mRNA; f:51270-53330